MANIGATSASARSASVTDYSISNVSVTSAAEETVVLPASTRRFEIRMRDLSEFEVRRTAAAADYLTIPCGNSFDDEVLNPNASFTFYITPAVTGVLEILSWT